MSAQAHQCAFELCKKSCLYYNASGKCLKPMLATSQVNPVAAWQPAKHPTGQDSHTVRKRKSDATNVTTA